MESIREKMKQRRLLLQRSVADVAREAGVSVSYIYAIEAGTRGSSIRQSFGQTCNVRLPEAGQLAAAARSFVFMG